MQWRSAMELQSAADAERLRRQLGCPHIIRAETRGVMFEKGHIPCANRPAGEVQFSQRQRRRRGRGVFSEEGQLRLIRDVHLKMDASSASKGNAKTTAAASEVDIQGSSLEFGKTTHTILLFGPVTATTSTQQLTAGELFVSLDPAFRARSLIARPGTLGQTPEVVSRDSGGGGTKLHADQLTAELSRKAGTTVVAEGNVDGSARWRITSRTWRTGDVVAGESGEAVDRARNVRLQSRDPKQDCSAT
jgi:hypothetical protein